MELKIGCGNGEQETPSTKPQTPGKLQSPSSNSSAPRLLEDWGLRFPWSLGFGIWSFISREALTRDNAPLYSALVDVFARSGAGSTRITAAALSPGPLAQVAQLVQPHLEEV
jgi:hypothetical protein